MLTRITFYLDEISFFLQFYKITLINKIYYFKFFLQKIKNNEITAYNNALCYLVNECK